MAAIADFAHKFGLVLKACNLSRGRLAQTVGVDKSVVSRWASGVQAPTDHNLTLLTEAVGRHRPGFARPTGNSLPSLLPRVSACETARRGPRRDLRCLHALRSPCCRSPT
jgi:transcriptional regulator with XRE-family HTH domain